VIARLQRRLCALWLLALAFAAQGMAANGGVGWGWLLLGLLIAHPLILALELVWMHQANTAEQVPRASPSQLLQAWGSETWHALRVFCWRQPFAHRRWPDLLPAVSAMPGSPGAPGVQGAAIAPAGGRGVLLVHGFVCNRGLWNRWLQRLHGLGVPVLALNLEPPFGSIDDYVAAIAEGVHKLGVCTGQAPVVVAHSMGGLAVRAWWAQAAPEAIAHLITLGTPHQGTRLARLAFSRNGRQMREHSAWLQTLAAREDGERRARSTCFFSHCDQIVFPATRATLDGARQLHLQACPHLAMVDHAQPWQALLEQLRA